MDMKTVEEARARRRPSPAASSAELEWLENHLGGGARPPVLSPSRPLFPNPPFWLVVFDSSFLPRLSFKLPLVFPSCLQFHLVVFKLWSLNNLWFTITHACIMAKRVTDTLVYVRISICDTREEQQFTSLYSHLVVEVKVINIKPSWRHYVNTDRHRRGKTPQN